MTAPNSAAPASDIDAQAVDELQAGVVLLAGYVDDHGALSDWERVRLNLQTLRRVAERVYGEESGS